jgi:hypothetical protein
VPSIFVLGGLNATRRCANRGVASTWPIGVARDPRVAVR